MRNLVLDEVRTDHGARLRPVVTIRRENAMAEQGAESVDAIAESVVFEFEGQDRFDVLGLARDDDGGPQTSGTKGVAKLTEARPRALEEDVFFGGIEVVVNAVEAQKWVFVDLTMYRLTVVRAGYAVLDIFPLESGHSINKENHSACKQGYWVVGRIHDHGG